MTDNNQPTILVKKADGTTERITLAELKARQSKPVAVVVEPVKVVEPEVVKVVEVVEPKIEKPQGLVVGPVEKKVIIPNQLAQDKIDQTPLKTADVKSLLNEEVPVSFHSDSIVAPAQLDQVSKIILTFSFKVPAQFENRLRSSVQLRLKDIRSENDTRDLCLRSIAEGGLGLSEPQAEELISKTKISSPIPAKKNTPVTFQALPPMPVIETMRKSDREAAVEKIIGQVPSAPIISDLISTKKIETNNAPSPLRSTPSQSFKPMVHDVQAKPVEMGPLDEIQYFSLIDLRRLSSQPTEAVSRLKQKFVNLKDESYVLFMESWAAWRKSPLYQSYLEVVDEALSQKFSLNAVLNSKEKILLAEVEAIAKMEKELDI